MADLSTPEGIRAEVLRLIGTRNRENADIINDQIAFLRDELQRFVAPAGN